MSRKEALDLFDHLQKESNDVFLQINRIVHGPNQGPATEDLLKLKAKLYDLINNRLALVLKELFPELAT